MSVIFTQLLACLGLVALAFGISFLIVGVVSYLSDK